MLYLENFPAKWGMLVARGASRSNSFGRANETGEKREKKRLPERKNEIRRTRSTLRSFPLNPDLTSGIRYSRQIPIFVGHFADEVARNDEAVGDRRKAPFIQDFDIFPEIFFLERSVA